MEWIHLRGSLRIGDRLEQLVLDAHCSARTAGLLRLLRRDYRHRLAEVAHAIAGEHRLVSEVEPVGLLSGDVLVRENRMHTRHADRFGRIDPDDSRVGVRAADSVAPEHSRGLEIARVGELAGDLRHGVGATTRRLGAASA